MNVDTLAAEARLRLVARARREGLATVGYATFASDLGPLWIAVGPRGVLSIHYGDEPAAAELARLVRAYGPGIVPDPRRASPVASQVEQYLARKRERFDLDVDLAGLTPFQQRILRATARVPYGELTTYAAVARRAGSERATRAAGAALGANPVPIVVPCHRVVASDGSLGGYAGGLRTKRRLLALEREGDVPRGGWPPSRR